jgi:hypothetical protein
MAAKRPVSQSTEVTQAEEDTGADAPAAVETDPTPAAPDSLDSSAPTEPAAAETPAAPFIPAQQVVYVEAPKPFVKKGNRTFGVLMALLSTVIFAALLALADVVADAINGRTADFGFIATLDFYAPVLMFAIGFVILVLVLNRAGWAAHVIGSIFVGLVTYFGGTGLILLLHINQIPSNEVAQSFTEVVFSSGLIISALLGREVSLWMGFAIAAHGRKVKARNVDARVLYDQEIAAKRAEYEQANARNAAQASGAQPSVAPAPVTKTPAAETAPAVDATPETAEASKS